MSCVFPCVLTKVYVMFLLVYIFHLCILVELIHEFDLIGTTDLYVPNKDDVEIAIVSDLLLLMLLHLSAHFSAHARITCVIH